jgi:hypothetical protein
MRHGAQEIIGDFTVTYLDPKTSLGTQTPVQEMYRARMHGASPIDDCVVFVEKGEAKCYRHLVCPAMPAIDEIRERKAEERRAEAVSS